jgi:imidazolonepropionase-like amidohydrolase
MKPQSLCHLALALAAVATPVAAQDLVAIRAGKVHTIAQGTLENAVILIEDGKIKAIGPDLEVPWNAKVVDAADKVVVPTWILAHTPGGMSGGNEMMQNVPFLTVQDAIDPSSLFFDEALRNGIGTAHVIPGNATLIGGQGMVVRPFGKTVEDMTVRDRGGLKLSLASGRGASRMAQMRKLRNALDDAVATRRDLERQRTEFEQEQAAGAIAADVDFEGEPDKTKKPVIDLLERKLTGYLYVPSAAEHPEVARLVEKYGLDLVLVLGPRCYPAAAQIKELGLPVILDDDAIEYMERDPETGEETLVCQAKILADAGIEFAVGVSENGRAPGRYPWWQLATMVRHGVDRATALRALTTVPARILGLGEQFGTVEVGRVANLQVLTGDPLAATTWVDTVLLEGEVVYRRAADQRLQNLFGNPEGQK